MERATTGSARAREMGAVWRRVVGRAWSLGKGGMGEWRAVRR